MYEIRVDYEIHAIEILGISETHDEDWLLMLSSLTDMMNGLKILCKSVIREDTAFIDTLEGGRIEWTILKIDKEAKVNFEKIPIHFFLINAV